MMDLLLLPRPLHWLLIAAALVFALSSLAFWAWGQFSRRARGEPSAALPPQSGETVLDHLIEPLLANHPETDSAAALIEANTPSACAPTPHALPGAASTCSTTSGTTMSPAACSSTN